MAIYAIGDLHLGFNVNKPMGIFGDAWTNHELKIKEHWQETIKEQDLVLIPGDISWAMTLEEAMEDLGWIDALPGYKVLVRGNHDYWWKSITKLNSMFDKMFFLQNNFYTIDNIAICGTRGWTCPNQRMFTDQDEKIYKRELQRLELSLNHAVKGGFTYIIAMLHYPPTNDEKQISGFTELMGAYGVDKVVYGHLHGQLSFDSSLIGKHGKTHYHLVSADYLDFQLYKVL
ncbi:metallophosphoesterase [Vallitalea okinawensis]|uniref:metallophosphoesterase n=1 Tax=Vallitalea okinawensis TaxID=2078660 RepID=UPI000CFB6580|nr:metallophosphoesterase [Vallitalea okinawensis]